MHRSKLMVGQRGTLSLRVLQHLARVNAHGAGIRSLREIFMAICPSDKIAGSRKRDYCAVLRNSLLGLCTVGLVAQVPIPPGAVKRPHAGVRGISKPDTVGYRITVDGVDALAKINDAVPRTL